MLKNTFVLVFTLALIGLFGFAFKPASAKITLKGTIKDATTESPIQDVQLVFFQKNNKVAETKTNQHGVFSTRLLAGTYTVICSRNGFVTVKFPQIEVKSSNNAELYILLEPNKSELEAVVVRDYVPGFAGGELEAEYATMPSGEYKTTARRKPATAPKEHSEKKYHAKRDAARDASSAEAPVAESMAPEFARVEPTAPAPPMDDRMTKSMPAVEDKIISRKAPDPKAGLLTAGEWNDLHNWNRHWLDLLADGEIAAYQKMYDFFPRHRYTVLVLNDQNYPAADIPVQLKSGSEIIWEARTDNTGKVELWANLYDQKNSENLTIEVWLNGKQQTIRQPKPAREGINLLRTNHVCMAPKNVDIVWAVDATGSMGDEIAYLKSELLDVIGRAKSLNQELSFRMGTVFYRDNGDEYITKSTGLNSDIARTVNFIKEQHAGGGGDMPEAVHSALEEAIFSQKWSDNAISRICFLVLDASPHQSAEVNASLQRSIREAARKGIRIVPVTASGIQKDTEFLMKFFGLATNGTYVFLTDHSGIGEKHLEPTTDEYKVELMNDLLVRLITEYTITPDCAGKTAIRTETNDQQQRPNWEVSYFPNPANDQVMFELPVGVQTLMIYDAEGKAVIKLEQPAEGSNQVVLRELPAGFYTIRVMKDGAQKSGKLLIVRA